MTYDIIEVDSAMSHSYPLRTNDSYTYQVYTGGRYSIGRFEPGNEVKAMLAAGEDAFQIRDFEAARKYFIRASSLDSAFSVPYAYLGQCAYAQGDLDAAGIHLDRALQLNYWDFIAHLCRANVLLDKDHKREAAREAALAYILNPNEPLVRSETSRIFQACGLDFKEFSFAPNYALTKDGTRVTIRMSMPWLMYAVCKAIWAHEPGYRRSMDAQGSPEFNLLEEKECLLNLLVSLREMPRKDAKEPAMEALSDAFDAQMLEQFILVEMWLPREPLIIYTQPRALLEGLVDYVITVRGGKRLK